MGNICGNNANSFKNDEDIKSFDTGVKAQMIQLFDSLNSSTDLCEYYVGYVCDWNQKTGELVFLLKKDVEGVKGKQSRRRRKKNSRFQNVVDEFEDNSQEMLDLLSELDKFINSVDKSHKSIEAVVREYFDKQGNPTDDHNKRIPKKLKDLMAGTNNEHLTESILPKVERLINMQKQLLEKLKIEKSKLAKKRQTTGTWKKVMDMLYIAGAAAICLCVVATAVLAAPSGLAIAAITTALAAGAGTAAIAGQQWTTTLLKQYQDHLQAEEDLVDAMHKHTRATRKGLGNIKHHIDLVVTDINSLFEQQDFGSSEKQINVTMEDILNKLEPFKKKIKDLKGQVDKCRNELIKTRDDVTKTGSALI